MGNPLTQLGSEINHHQVEKEGPRTPLEVAKSQDIELGFVTHFEGTLKAEFVLLMLQSKLGPYNLNLWPISIEA